MRKTPRKWTRPTRGAGTTGCPTSPTRDLPAGSKATRRAPAATRRRRPAAGLTTPGILRVRVDRNAGWDNGLLPWRLTLEPWWSECRRLECPGGVGKIRVQRTCGAFLLDQGVD